jgi:FMN phosphatase YigB (HAD superfamily)
MPESADAHLTVIVDVDNTLYDWVAVWAGAFSALVRSLADASGYDEAFWIERAQAVHRQHGAIECPSLLTDLAAAGTWPAAVDPAHLLQRAAAAYRQHWDQQLRLYEGVREALVEMAWRGHHVVAYTESDASIAANRLGRLGLSSVIRCVFGRPPLPSAAQDCCLVNTATAVAIPVQLIPREENKPRPEGLRRVMAWCSAAPSRTVYVGDNLWKDVAMARAAGVTAVWARYGTTRVPAHAALLERAAHWTSADVSSERRATRSSIAPDAIVDDPLRLSEIVVKHLAQTA